MSAEKLNNFILENFPHIKGKYEVQATGEKVGIYHISTNDKIPEFIPMVSTRTMKEEDRTVPRICACTHLHGCLAGYFATVDDFSREDKGFRGGYYIYSLPTEAVVRPNSELVPDAPETDEVWVVGHDENHNNVVGNIVGKIFMSSILSYGPPANRKYNCTHYLHTTVDMYLNGDKWVGPGYYKLNTEANMGGVLQLDQFMASKTTKAEYDKAKKLSASLLSFEARCPSGAW